MATQEELAISLQKELKVAAQTENDESKLRIISCIQNELSWTADLEEKADLLKDLRSLTIQYSNQEPPSRMLVDLARETIEKLRRDKRENHLRVVHGRWWRDPPLPCSKDASIEVFFEDITVEKKQFQDEDEVWPTERVLASPDEPFDDLFARFRTQANKQHRHPYRPTLSFDVVLSDASLLRISTAGSISVRDILARVAPLHGDHPPKVPYVRNDDDRSAQLEQQKLPIWSFAPWDRTLPSWFAPTPPTWLDPSPPPAFNNLPHKPWNSLVKSYKKVPTLVIPGNGRNILPSTTTPSVISAYIYLTVHITNDGFTSFFKPEPESDHVLSSDRLIPPLSRAQAISLLSRPIQFSTQPFPVLDDKPKAKKRRKEISREKEARDIGYAWGLDPDKMLLHCFLMINRQNKDFVIDLNVRASEVRQAPPEPPKWDAPQPSPMAIPKMYIEWVGPVTLPGDKRVVASGPFTLTEPEPVFNHDSEEVLARSLTNKVKSLNASEASQLLEVKEDDALLFGDVHSAKGEGKDGFESSLPDVRPGIWTIRAEQDESNSRTLYLCWVGIGPLDSAFSTIPSTSDTSSISWEPLSTFSVDAGTAGIFTQSAFSDDGILDSYGSDVQVTLETLVDLMLLGSEEIENLIATFSLVVPGGVICSVGDGTYEVVGKRDESGLLTAIKIAF